MLLGEKAEKRGQQRQAVSLLSPHGRGTRAVIWGLLSSSAVGGWDTEALMGNQPEIQIDALCYGGQVGV